MWELDCEESWAPKNWCFWTVVLEKTPESPLDCKEIQPVHPKGDQSWVFTGRTDAEAETPVFCLPDVNWLFGKAPDAGKDWGQEERGRQSIRWLDGITDSMDVSWKLKPRVGDGQGGLTFCGPWRCKESDMTEWLNWTEELLPGSPSISSYIFVGDSHFASIPFLKVILKVFQALYFLP